MCTELTLSKIVSRSVDGAWLGHVISVVTSQGTVKSLNPLVPSSDCGKSKPSGHDIQGLDQFSDQLKGILVLLSLQMQPNLEISTYQN